jgi:hypothetical protein
MLPKSVHLSKGDTMPELKLWVPTYYGDRSGEQVDGAKREEFGDPLVPVVVRPAEGVRVVLGSHDYWDASKPDIQIERRPTGWIVFLHPLGGSDPSGCVFFTDDGRSYVVAENDVGPTRPIRLLPWEDAVQEVDRGPSANAADGEAQAENQGEDENCELCSDKPVAGDDNWGGVCPVCADIISTYLDLHGLDNEHRDTVAHLLRHISKPHVSPDEHSGRRRPA